jgi:hypothetical protein
MASRTIATPEPGFSGTRAGVAFRDGVAVVDSGDTSALAYFARHGYPVDTAPAPARRGRPKAKAAERVAEADEPPVGADPEPEG